MKKRKSEGSVQVKYADLWGSRDGKYRNLLENDVSMTEWQTLEPLSPHFFFVPKDFDLLGEYERGWSVTDIFPVNSSGIKTHRDYLVVDFDKNRLVDRFKDIASNCDEEQLRERYGIKDTGSWMLKEARKRISLQTIEDLVYSYLYRPFDIRYIYYSGDFVERNRRSVMRYVLQDNIGLVANRTTSTNLPFTHLFVSNLLVDVRMLPDYGGAPYIFPLYLYTTPEDTEGSLFTTEEVNRKPNLAPKFIAAVKEKLGLDFVPDGKGNLQSDFGPEDILHYAYAVFHSPTYRERYAEFLKIDFPRLPLTSDRDQFKMLAKKDEELVALHLMKSSALSQLTTSFPVTGSNEVVKVRYTEPRKNEKGSEVPGRVYINKTQYFEGIEPEVWAFQIGGYQVLHKWLKDRKGRKLSFDDLFHYQRIVVALKETICLMAEIDEVIPDWPI